MAKDTEVQIEIDVLTVLENGRYEGNKFYLPEGQLDRKLYVGVKKILEMLGGKWTGGKTQAFVFQDDVEDVIDAALTTGKVTNWKKLRQFFETPEEVVAILINIADIGTDHKVLEPSAGRGAIARKLPDEVIKNLTLFEIDTKNAQHLADSGYSVNEQDFLSCDSRHFNAYDRIIANPPFSKGQDAEHITHMFKCLKPGGKLVSVASTAVRHRTDRRYTEFREFLESNGGQTFGLPPNAFKESGTGVSTCIVVLKK